METSFLCSAREQYGCYPSATLLATDALTASHLVVPSACLPTCASPPRKACADDHREVSFCHVGFSESSSSLLQRANSLIPAGAWRNDRWEARGLSVWGLCTAAPADRYVPDASISNNIVWDKPTKGKLFETKINKINKRLFSSNCLHTMHTLLLL